MKARIWALCLVFVAFWGAAAEAQEPPFGYEVTQMVMEGQPVEIVFHSSEALDTLEVNITRLKPKDSWAFSRKNLGGGDSVVFTLEQGPGNCSYKMDVRATSREGEYEGSTTFEVASMEPLDIDVDLSVDLREGTLKFSANRPIGRAEIELFAEGKKPIDAVEKDYGGNSSKAEISWTPGEDTPVLVNMKVYDTYQMWRDLQVFRLEVPHEDVVFDTNESMVRSDQAPKLEASLVFITETLQTYDEVLIELYVAGYTDTVGKPADNQKLSEKRAKSIATWFRGHGVKVPIYYQGFGEAALAVATADEVDAQANRRAVYLMSNSKPATSTQFPNASWTKVK